MSRYHDMYSAWQRDPVAFWAEAARDIEWYSSWTTAFEPYLGHYGRWFPCAHCNTAHNS